jgi:hypothetical protein
MTLTTLLIILLVLVLFGGWYGQRDVGWWGWSPAGALLLVLLILYLMGRLR